MQYNNVVERFEHEAIYERAIISYDDDPDPGILLDEMISKLQKQIPNIMMAPHSEDLVPLIADDKGILHLVFAGQEVPDLPVCNMTRSFKSDRLPLNFFTEEDNEIHIVIFDESIGEPVAMLAYREAEYRPEGWELIRKVALPTMKIPSFIRLAREIQYSKLESLFEVNPSETP